MNLSYNVLLCAAVATSLPLLVAGGGGLPPPPTDICPAGYRFIPFFPYCIENCVFAIDYSEDGCGESASAVAMKGYLSNTTYSVLGQTAYETCAQNTVCRLDPEDAAICPLPSGSGDDTTAVYDVRHLRGEDGTIYDAKNTSFILGPNVCRSGNWYGGCGSYNYQSLDDLQNNPEILANDNPKDLEQIKDFYYLVYYEDDSCTDLSGVVAATSGQQLDVPLVSNPDLSCTAQAICGLDPTSETCQFLRDGDAVAEIVAETRTDETTGEMGVYECDSSNEAAGEETCKLVLPRDCNKSSIFSNCFYRKISGPALAQNPRNLVGEFGVDEEVGDPSGEKEADDEGTVGGGNDDAMGDLPDSTTTSSALFRVPSTVAGLLSLSLSLLFWNIEQ